MNKKTGITRACQRFGRMVETRDITGLRHLLRYYSPNNGIEHSTWRVIVTPWSWWDRSDRIAVILIFPIFHTYRMAISFSSCLLFLTLGSPLIRFIYHGPKFTTPGSHYRINTRSKADGKCLLLKFGDLCSPTQVWILIKFLVGYLCSIVIA